VIRFEYFLKILKKLRTLTTPTMILKEKKMDIFTHSQDYGVMQNSYTERSKRAKKPEYL